MRTTIITRENQLDYLPLLTEEEIFGLDTGRLTLVGAFNEETGEAMGVISVWVLPEYIRINRFCTHSGTEDSSVRKALLSVITQIPGDIRLPIFYFTADPEEDVDFLLSNGFTEENSRYFYIEARLKDMMYIPETGEEDAYEVRTLEYISEEELDRFILRSPHDEFIQFPELPVIPVETDRFSDGSLFCFKDGKLEAAIMFKDYDGAITVTWVGGEEPEDIYYLFSVFKKRLLQEQEFGPDSRILFLYHEDGSRAGTVGKMLRDSKKVPIRILKLKR